MIDFYTNGHDVIGAAVAQFLTDHARSSSTHHDELAAIKQELKENTAAVDRYLIAFEKGTLDDEDEAVQTRLTKLKSQSRQLRARRAELEFDLDKPPAAPSLADLSKVRDHVVEVIASGDHKAKKSLFEALIEDVEIQSDDSLVPYFRIPIMRTDQGLAPKPFS